jgi:HK97 family phage major capsid protein
MSTKLRQLQEELYVKQDAMSRIFDEARRGDGTYDFTEATAFQHLDNQKACLETLDQLEKELDDLQAKVATQEAIEEQDKRLKEKRQQRAQITEAMVHPSGNGQNGNYPVQQKTLGEMVADAWPRDREARGSSPILFDREFKTFNFKTLMTTTANGFPPESTRIPRVAEFAHRPIQVTDLMPVGTTDQPNIVFMRETVSTNNAGEIAEGADMSATEAVLTWAAVTVPVRKLVAFIPATEEQLADVPQVQALIDARLRFFLQQKLDSQILVGANSAPQILGILNQTPTTIQSQAKGTDPSPDAIYKAMVKVRVTGRATPTAVIIHPNDLQDIRLLRSSDGFYIWGHPSVPGPMTLFGVPIVEADVITENTALVGDFTNHCMLWLRQGVEVAAGYLTNDFRDGIQTIRATMRATITVFRPAAFCAVTSL